MKAKDKGRIGGDVQGVGGEWDTSVLQATTNAY
jgi:hypothetical protein